MRFFFTTGKPISPMEKIEYEINSKIQIGFGLKELWENRELLYFFTWRDIKVKYKQTVLGILWAILQPIILMLTFTLFFNHSLGVKSGSVPYPVFVFSGLIIWNIFSNGVGNAGNSMVSNAGIIKKIYFPRLIIPISSILVALFDFLLAFLVELALLFYYHVSFSPVSLILSISLSLIITLLSGFGLGCLLASLNVKYRDFRYIIPFLLQIWLFATPVLYPISFIHNKYISALLSLNPMVGASQLSRSFMDGSPIINLQVGISLLAALVLFLGGLFYFRKTEAYFADIA